MMGLPYGEEIMIVGGTMWTQSTSVTVRRTDIQTDRITITNTVQRRASHGKNLEVGMVWVRGEVNDQRCRPPVTIRNMQNSRLRAALPVNITDMTLHFNTVQVTKCSCATQAAERSNWLVTEA